MSGKRNRLVLSIFLIIGSLGIVRAQDPAATGTVYVSVKVTEAAGRYVSGLTKEDFGIAEEGIEQIVSFLEEDVREYEYRIGYVPKNGAKNGGWRRIRVRVVNPIFERKLSVLATMGYYAR